MPRSARRAASDEDASSRAPGPAASPSLADAVQSFETRIAAAAPSGSDGEPAPAGPPDAPEATPGRRRKRKADEVDHVVTAADDILVTAFLEQLQREENPWELLAQVQKALDERKIGISNRHQFYKQFTVLVATVPKAEEDALLQAGKAVFGYQLSTAREDVVKLRGLGASGTKPATSFFNDELMAEIIRVPEELQPVKYLIYYHATGLTDVADELKTGSTVLLPPQSPLFEKNKIWLANSAEEYGTQADLFELVRVFVSDYVQIENKNFLSVLAFYAFLTWIYDKFNTVPYLRVIGDYGTGKSRLLQVLQSIAYRGLLVGGSLTAAPIYRVIEQCGITLVIDEADFSDSDLQSDITQILNSGYTRNFGVLRTERSHAGPFEVDYYDTYGPKILASRRRFKDQALESRCFSYTMMPQQVNPKIPLILDDEFFTRAQTLRNKLLLWRFRHWPHAQIDPRLRFANLDSRLNQIVLPLLSIADDNAMRSLILEEIRSYQTLLQAERRESLEGTVALALLGLLTRNTGTRLDGRVMVKEVAERINVMQEGSGVKVNNRDISSVIRNTLNLKTYLGNGVTWVRVEPKDKERLQRRYATDENGQDEAAPVAVLSRRTAVVDDPVAAPPSAPAPARRQAAD